MTTHALLIFPYLRIITLFFVLILGIKIALKVIENKDYGLEGYDVISVFLFSKICCVT